MFVNNNNNMCTHVTVDHQTHTRDDQSVQGLLISSGNV